MRGKKISNLPGNQGSLAKAEVKKKVLREVLNCEREQLCRMWVGRLFQTGGAWTENDRWLKHLRFHFAQEWVFSLELEWRVRDGVYAERQDDRYGGRVPSKKRKAKVIILKSILYLTEPVKLFEKWCNMLMTIRFRRRHIWSKVMSISTELQ